MTIKESNLTTSLATDLTGNDYVRVLDNGVSRKMLISEFITMISNEDSFVLNSGDTMTGALTIESATLAKLIVQATGVNLAQVDVKGTLNTSAVIDLTEVGGGKVGKLVYDYSANTITITVGGTDALVIDNAGTVAAQINMTVAGASTVSGLLTADGGILSDDTIITGTLDVTGITTINDLTISATSTVSAGSNIITNVTDPVANQDAATKNYVDAAIASGRGAHVYNSSSQSLSDATFTFYTYDSEQFDTDNIHSTVSNTERLTVPAGVTKVIVSGQATFQKNATGCRSLAIYKNADANYPGVGYNVEKAAGAASDDLHMSLYVTSPVLTVTSGDYFRLNGFQNSGTSLSTTGYTTINWFTMRILE